MYNVAIHNYSTLPKEHTSLSTVAAVLVCVHLHRPSSGISIIGRVLPVSLWQGSPQPWFCGEEHLRAIKWSVRLRDHELKPS